MDKRHWIDRMADEEAPVFDTGIAGTWKLVKTWNGNSMLRLESNGKAIQLLLGSNDSSSSQLDRIRAAFGIGDER